MRAYSHRLSWDFSPNALSRVIAEKRRRGVPLLDLTISNPTEAFANYPHDAVRSAYANIADFSYTPEPFGAEEARRAIAESYAERAIAISPDQILLTASTSEAYALLFKLFCDPEDEILAPIPSYPLFDFLARLESVRLVPYRLSYDGRWFIDFASFREGISRRTRAIVIVNPNNPTGSFLKECEKKELFEIAERHDLPIISDEVFMDYPLGSIGQRIPTLIGCERVLSFSLNGLSKTAGMPQVKLGWVAVNGPSAERAFVRERMEVLFDTYLSVSTPVQQALPQLLKIGAGIRRQIAERIQGNLGTLDRLLGNSPAHRLYTEGGWSAILRLPRTSTEDTWVTRFAEEHDVIVQPGYFFDMGSEPYVVVSLITAPEILEEGIRRIVRHVCS